MSKEGSWFKFLQYVQPLRPAGDRKKLVIKEPLEIFGFSFSFGARVPPIIFKRAPIFPDCVFTPNHVPPDSRS